MLAHVGIALVVYAGYRVAEYISEEVKQKKNAGLSNRSNFRNLLLSLIS